jgi:hypothetical protein
MSVPPLLLIHYGNSAYLPYAIKVARRFNPGREILFLGDHANVYLAELGVRHYPLDQFRSSPELRQFDRFYHRIVNQRYPKPRWAQFVSQRWFMINTFITEHHIDQFWTFDSDNFILADLGQFEASLSQYDCTSQCRGRCLNGFISNKAIVQSYVQKMNDLVSDDAYVASWQAAYLADPRLFYNEMEAFAVFAQEAGLRNCHLAQIRDDGSMFDDSITYDNGMEMCRGTIKGRPVKQLYMHDGQIYCRHLASSLPPVSPNGRGCSAPFPDSFIRMNSLNLSWMPKYVFRRLYEYLVSLRSPGAFTPLDLLRAPPSYHVKWFIRNHIPQPIRDRLARGAYWV